MYRRFKLTARNFVFPWINHLRYRGNKRYCPICRSNLSIFLPAGITPRSEALCPVCGSLERHRLLWLYFEKHTNLFTQKELLMLHIAPEQCLERKFRKIKSINYITGDLSDESVLVRFDITNLCFPNRKFDVILVSHVLEHIVDDWQAMRELARVLKPCGWATFQTPVDFNREKTYEDSSIIDPNERLKVFGQQDHIRIYGRDYVTRMEQSGFHVDNVNFFKEFTEKESNRLGLKPFDEICLCTTV